MKLAIGIFLFSLSFAAVPASAQRDYCFHNVHLKVSQTVSFTLTGNKVDGTFDTGGTAESTSSETFEFTGTKAGNLLTVKFVGKPPYDLPPGTNRIVWTIHGFTLTIPMYDTRTSSTFVKSYGKCADI